MRSGDLTKHPGNLLKHPPTRCAPTVIRHRKTPTGLLLATPCLPQLTSARPLPSTTRPCAGDQRHQVTQRELSGSILIAGESDPESGSFSNFRTQCPHCFYRVLKGDVDLFIPGCISNDVTAEASSSVACSVLTVQITKEESRLNLG